MHAASNHNLVVSLADRIAAQPDSIAMVAPQRRGDVEVSYREFGDRIGRVASSLTRRGIRPGDRILLMHGISPDLYVGLAAAWQVGAVACLVDPGAGLSRFEALSARIAPKAVLGGRLVLWLRWLSPTLRRVRVAAPVGKLARESEIPIESIAMIDRDHPALLTFTSGSTGNPKAIVRSHGLLHAQLEAIREAIELQAGERDLLTLPVFALANLACGLTTVIADANLRHVGRVDPTALFSQISRCKIIRCTASPAFFERLLDHAEARGQRLTLKKAFTGGAPVFPSLMDRLQTAMPDGARVTAIYGSTEAEPISELERTDIEPADRNSMRSGGGLLAGRLSPHVRLRIIAEPAHKKLTPEEFTSLEMPMNQPGEIVVAGDHVVPGYLDGVGDEATKLHVGSEIWHRTGDLGYVDAKSRLWLLGRPDGAVVDGDGATYPFAVESAAMSIPGVVRTALIGHEDQRVLFIETKSSHDVARIVQELYSNEAVNVDQIIPIDQIPVDKRHNAKVDYPALRTRLKQHLINTHHSHRRGK